MKKNSIKAGLLGSGFAAGFHLSALQKIHSVNIDIGGAYSPNQDRLKAFASDTGIKTYLDPNKLIDDCDVIHICTPPSTHEKLVIDVLKKDKHVIVEKPFTGYFGDGTKSFNGDTFPRIDGLKHSRESINRMLEAEKESKGLIMYAENWIYSPVIQKEKEVIEKSSGQILWMQAQQSHSGSHSLDYGNWQKSGGGSLMGKGCHPISAAIYLKRVEGQTRFGKPIRPKTVSARTHALTRMKNYKDEGQLKNLYKDVEDYVSLHIVFEDGTFADIVASELLQGGVKNYLEVHASNHRTICNMGPNNAMQTFNPVDDNFKDIYLVEKTATKQGWSFMSPDESWFNGYQHEMDAFYRSVAFGEPVESNSELAADTIAIVYAGYLSAERYGAEVEI